MQRKIRRLKINRLLRLVLLLVTVLTSCILSYMLYREVMIPTIKEEKVQLYSFTNKSSIDYKVLSKPNGIYSGSSLGEGQYYLTNYVDIIQATFNYEFTGDKAANLKGNYEVVATVEGYTTEEEQHITIWEKKFVLVPKKDFSIKDKLLYIKENVNIKLSEYNDFGLAVTEDSKAELPLQLNVYMIVNFNIDTEKNQLENKISPTITIPLGKSYFSVSESESKEEPGSIEETRSIKLPPGKLKLMIYKCGLAGALLMLLVIIIFTETNRKSSFVMQLDKIFKVHGNRMVALSSDLLASSLENCNIVRGIDDLVRISDEIGKPIMYEYVEEYKDIVHFYVLDDKRTYLYILRDALTGSKVGLSNGKKFAL